MVSLSIFTPAECRAERATKQSMFFGTPWMHFCSLVPFLRMYIMHKRWFENDEVLQQGLQPALEIRYRFFLNALGGSTISQLIYNVFAKGSRGVLRVRL